MFNWNEYVCLKESHPVDEIKIFVVMKEKLYFCHRQITTQLSNR